jgi:hypothetical protein
MSAWTWEFMSTWGDEEEDDGAQLFPCFAVLDDDHGNGAVVLPSSKRSSINRIYLLNPNPAAHEIWRNGLSWLWRAEANARRDLLLSIELPAATHSLSQYPWDQSYSLPPPA